MGDLKRYLKAIAPVLLGWALGLLLCLLIGTCLSSCRTRQVLVETVKVEKRTEYQTDTVYVDLPQQSASIDTPQGKSHLETDIAQSDAWINEDGTLHHDLSNKDVKLSTQVLVKTEYVDSIIEKPVPCEVPVFVDKPLSWWQKFQIKGFWIFVALFALAAVWAYERR